MYIKHFITFMSPIKILNTNMKWLNITNNTMQTVDILQSIIHGLPIKTDIFELMVFAV